MNTKKLNPSVHTYQPQKPDKQISRKSKQSPSLKNDNAKSEKNLPRSLQSFRDPSAK